MRLMVCSIVAVFVCASFPTTADVQSPSNCQNVRGSVQAQIRGNSRACPVAVIVGQVFDETDTQIGETTACITQVEHVGPKLLRADLSHTYTIGNLNFTTIDEGLLELIGPSIYRFENHLTIVDGASGFLRARGTVDFRILEVDLTYNGRICVED